MPRRRPRPRTLQALHQAWGDNLRSARETTVPGPVTQDALALAVGAAQQSISKWERGLSAPDEVMRVALARVLRRDVYDLFPPYPGRKPSADQKRKNGQEGAAA